MVPVHSILGPPVLPPLLMSWTEKPELPPDPSSTLQNNFSPLLSPPYFLFQQSLTNVTYVRAPSATSHHRSVQSTCSLHPNKSPRAGEGQTVFTLAPELVSIISVGSWGFSYSNKAFVSSTYQLPESPLTHRGSWTKSLQIPEGRAGEADCNPERRQTGLHLHTTSQTASCKLPSGGHQDENHLPPT